MTATVSQPAAAGDADDAARPGAEGGGIAQAGEQRLTRLESLRALGSLSVLSAHVLTLALAGASMAGTYQHRLIYGTGLLSLYIFFAMSGFLLYLPFARRQLSGGRKIDVGRYARNRMLRILPLYVTVIVVLLLIQPYGADRADWWRWLTFTQNFSEHTIHRLDAPLWSVVVEVQFYIALPILAWAIAKLGGRSFARTLAVLIALAIGSWLLRSQQVVNADVPNTLGLLGEYSMPSYLYIFIGGMLLAVLRLAWERHPPAWAERPLLGGSGAWIAAAVPLQLIICRQVDIDESYIAALAAVILAACVLPLRAGRILKALEWRPLAALGVASFSLYLWHWPILQALSGVHLDAAPGGAGVTVVGDPTDFKTLLVIGLPICITVGAVSYWLIERPFLQRRVGWGATVATARAEPAQETASAKT